MQAFLSIALIIIMVYYLALYTQNNKSKSTDFPTTLVGLITNFLDFWGIGSFAPQTVYLNNKVKNKYQIPMILNIANLIPIVLEALFFINNQPVQIITLIVLAISAAVGSYFGAKYIKIENEYKINLIVGISLLIAGTLLIMKANNIAIFGQQVDNLAGFDNNPGKLLIAAIGFAILGAMQSLGLGLYAPGFALLGLLGMGYLSILPINMVASITLMLANSRQFIKSKQYNFKLTNSIMFGGIIGVVIAGVLLINLSSDFSQIKVGTITLIQLLMNIVGIIAIYTGIMKFVQRKGKNVS